ncbi:MAG: 3-phenylpropionate/cinnamic acid dioxygenase subunit beta [Actinomycetota bacterium]|nr:3-phenylpropionate/cinnamic acid dioxygenase subunit beta [Actinomycetota bacterium]
MSVLSGDVSGGLQGKVSSDIHFQLEQFLYFEAELLDARRFSEWFELTAEDIRYWMPLRTNRSRREQHLEVGPRGSVSLFDDDKRSLSWRVAQLETEVHWAEDPPSRTRHLVTNVRAELGAVAGEYSVRSNFMCYRNRNETETDIWVGTREDVIRDVGGGEFALASRVILLDQNVVTSKNLSVIL